MPRLTRQPTVALLAALAALLAPLGVTAAGSVAVAVRQAVAGATTQATGQPPAGRITAGRELRDTVARRAPHGRGAEVSGVLPTGSERAWQGGSGAPPVTPVGVAPLGVPPLGVVVLLAAAWWARRGQVGGAPVGRTPGIRSGRGPPQVARA